jgi:hypothetical protein
MKTLTAIGLSALMISSLLCCQTFQQHEQVELIVEPYTGQKAIVYDTFAKMWPGQRIKDLARNTVISYYLDRTGENQPYGIEKYIYCVHVDNELLAVHASWMKKIAQPSFSNVSKIACEKRVSCTDASATASIASSDKSFSVQSLATVEK